MGWSGLSGRGPHVQTLQRKTRGAKEVPARCLPAHHGAGHDRRRDAVFFRRRHQPRGDERPGGSGRPHHHRPGLAADGPIAAEEYAPGIRLAPGPVARRQPARRDGAPVRDRNPGQETGAQSHPEELLEATQRISWLYSNGSFIGMDADENQIQQQTGMTVAQFEAELRESLLFDKIRATVTDGMQVSPAEVHEEFVRRNAKTKIEYVLFDPSQFLKAVEVAPQALDTFFKKDPERYIVPEQRRVRYALIQPDLVRARVRLGESELRQYYTQHLSDYRVPERVKVAHILFKTTEKTPAEIATIEKTAQDALNQVKSGKDFGELAKKYSEDSSASNGGEIGWIVRGQTVKEVENAAFSMKPGLTSGTIKTTYGIHTFKGFDKQ